MTQPPKRILVLGSTGSIGRQTLEVVRHHPQRLQVVGLAAGSNAELLAQQANDFQVRQVALAEVAAAERLGGGPLEVFAGVEGLCALVAACEPDLVVGAISGIAGLRPLLRALEAGVDCALANKEPLVAAGAAVMVEDAEFTGTRLVALARELLGDRERLQAMARAARAAAHPHAARDVAQVVAAAAARGLAAPGHSI